MNLHQTSYILLFWHLLLILALSEALHDAFYECHPGVRPLAGVIVPREDVIAKVGSEPFPVYCHLNPDYAYFSEMGLRADNLSLTVRSANRTEKLVLKSQVLNHTTIMAMYQPQQATVDLVDCMLKIPSLKAVCTRSVFVGYEPQPPDNFKCISYNWESLNCSWTTPDNPVHTDYTLSYLEPGRHGHERPCPAETATRQSCSWSTRTEPHFRQTIQTYRLRMTVSNGLSSRDLRLRIPIVTKSVVKPNAPQQLQLTPSGPHSLSLQYHLDLNLHFFPGGFQQSIMYKSKYDPSWLDHNETFLPSEMSVFMTELQELHPFTEYLVQVRLRSPWANISDPTLWSEPVLVNATTLSTIPDQPPLTTLGSFESVSSGLNERIIFVYWQQIPEYAQNGPEFQYKITEVLEGTHLRPLLSSRQTPAYSQFRAISDQNYTFFVTSANSQGQASDTSRVFVPTQNQLRRLRPKSLTKIAYSKTLVELSWLPAEDSQEVVSFTVFKCRSLNNRDRPYQCEGQLDWTELSPDQTSVNLTLPADRIYQFAVAANSVNYSSGMVWASCTILHDRIVGKLHSVSIDIVQKRALKVVWRLDCSDRVGIVTGYNISYCAIASANSSLECLQPQITQPAPPDEEHVWLSNLEPWTYYKVTVAVLTRAGHSEWSDFLVDQTLADRPDDPPQNLSAHLRSSNVVRLTWKEPSKPNGPIAYYEVRYAYQDRVDRQIEKSMRSDRRTAEIPGLDYYRPYRFRVRACAEMPSSLEPVCSKEWATTNMRTGIGESKAMPAPEVIFLNATRVQVSWRQHSFHHGGPIVRFDINITYQRIHTEHILSVPGDRSEAIISLEKLSQELDWVAECYNASALTNLFNVSIRAVTQDPSSKQIFMSPWSPMEILPAYCPESFPLALLLCLCISVPVLVFLLFYYLCRCINWQTKTSKMFIDIKSNHSDHMMKRQVQTHTAAPDEEEQNKNQEMLELTPSLRHLSGQQPAYLTPQNHHKDFIQTLLIDKSPRNASGHSDSTSGCGSGSASYQDSDGSLNASRCNSLDRSFALPAFQPGCTNYVQVKDMAGTSSADPATMAVIEEVPATGKSPMANNGYVSLASVLAKASTSSTASSSACASVVPPVLSRINASPSAYISMLEAQNLPRSGRDCAASPTAGTALLQLGRPSVSLSIGPAPVATESGPAPMGAVEPCHPSNAPCQV